MTKDNKQAKTTGIKLKNNYETAIFAGGCFWCMKSA